MPTISRLNLYTDFVYKRELLHFDKLKKYFVKEKAEKKSIKRAADQSQKETE